MKEATSTRTHTHTHRVPHPHCLESFLFPADTIFENIRFVFGPILLQTNLVSRVRAFGKAEMRWEHISCAPYLGICHPCNVTAIPYNVRSCTYACRLCHQSESHMMDPLTHICTPFYDWLNTNLRRSSPRSTHTWNPNLCEIRITTVWMKCSGGWMFRWVRWMWNCG